VWNAESRPFSRTLCLIATLSLLLVPVRAGEQERPDTRPHYDYRERAQPYTGPGRDVPDPQDLESVSLGYFGPSDPTHPDYGNLWVAAQLALKDLNAAGGYRGTPFQLFPVWSDNPWGTGVAQVVKLVYQQEIWALLGSVDGDTTHLVSQVVAKARLPQINPGATDKTANLANVPWTFSCLPGEHLQVGPLIAALEPRLRGGPFAVISTVNHDARVFTGELTRRLSERGHAPSLHAHFNPAASGSFDFLDQIRDRDWAAVVVVAPPHESARILAALRPIHNGPIFGSASFGRSRFADELEAAGLDPGELIFPYPADIESVSTFSARFRAETGRPADYATAQTYDAVLLLAQAIETAGLNRVRIHDALRALVPWQGEAAGTVLWDRTGQNTRPVPIVTFKGGRIVAVHDSMDRVDAVD
jgi:branched-chain amino acid transport system substrate-binding protein